MEYRITKDYSYARDRLSIGIAMDAGEPKTMQAIENVVAVIDEYVYGKPTVVGGTDFLEMTQQLSRLRSQGLSSIRSADAELRMMRSILAGLKMLVLVRDCGVAQDEVPSQIDALLEPEGPEEVDRVIEYLLAEVSSKGPAGDEPSPSPVITTSPVEPAPAWPAPGSKRWWQRRR